MKVAMRDIMIRKARSGDADALTDLCMISKQSNGYDDAFMDACRDELRVTPERLDQWQFWVAAVATDICGCASLCIGDDDATGEVSAFFVHPDWQGKGVGKQLWAALQQSAKDKETTLLHLDSDPAAVPFYESLGFKVIGETPSGSIPGRKIPYMELAL